MEEQQLLFDFRRIISNEEFECRRMTKYAEWWQWCKNNPQQLPLFPQKKENVVAFVTKKKAA